MKKPPRTFDCERPPHAQRLVPYDVPSVEHDVFSSLLDIIYSYSCFIHRNFLLCPPQSSSSSPHRHETFFGDVVVHQNFNQF